jgi:hypothetical protein
MQLKTSLMIAKLDILFGSSNVQNYRPMKGGEIQGTTNKISIVLDVI